MKTSIQALIGLVLVLIVVIGIYAAASGVFGNAGQNIEGGGEQSGDQLDCILNNPSSSESACRDQNTDLEVKQENVQKV